MENLFFGLEVKVEDTIEAHLYKKKVKRTYFFLYYKKRTTEKLSLKIEPIEGLPDKNRDKLLVPYSIKKG
ncbi:hypothetical protein [Flavobacterium sp.]|uniref:hypothetical protein n=1 Tax=Flavobacterium sp. TaxID=239 RepID=UPI0037C0C38C